ncbi:hypothetical protein PFISCL1PPCAC_7142, partial [Pristionchus fissidentatus]
MGGPHSGHLCLVRGAVVGSSAALFIAVAGMLVIFSDIDLFHNHSAAELAEFKVIYEDVWNTMLAPEDSGAMPREKRGAECSKCAHS